MGVLTEKIRWVTSLTMEGDRLSADDLVFQRDMMAGVRIDRPGFRISFIAAALALFGSLVLSIAAFIDTRQFFDPDYTLFALSLFPVIGAAAATYILRPRNHLTVMLRDGSALVMVSRDATFLGLCLEAFERMWLDQDRARASLYLHAGHRSVDFGPAITGAPVETLVEPRSEAADLPRFPAEIESEPLDAPMMDAPVIEPPVIEPPVIEPPVIDEPVADVPQTGVSEAVTEDDDGAPTVVDNEPAATPPPMPDLPEQSFEPEVAEASDEAIVPASLFDDLPMPGKDQGADDADTGKDQETASDAPLPDWAQPAEVTEERYLIDPAVFDETRPRIEALTRLLHDRASGQGVADAIDVLELLTHRGIANRREDRALRRAIEVLNGKLSMYPAAIELLEEVSVAAGEPHTM